MLTVKKWTEELELRQELRNLIWFYPHSYWLHLSVTGRKQTCWMPASPCLSIATVRHLNRRGELFPSGKCDQLYHHSCRLVGQSGSRVWWLGEWLASTWKFSADRINLFLLPLPSWLFLPWFNIFFYYLKLWEGTVLTRNRHFHKSSKFQTNLHCCCPSLCFPLLQAFVNTQVSKEYVTEKLKKLNSSTTCKFSRETFLLDRCFLFELLFLEHTNLNLFIFSSLFQILLIRSISLCVCFSPLPILPCKVFRYVEKNSLFFIHWQETWIVQTDLELHSFGSYYENRL